MSDSPVTNVETTAEVGDTLEVKLVPLDRRTGEPVATCIEHAPVALRVSVGTLVEIFGGSADDQRERIMAVGSMARLLGELFGAHVVFRFAGTDQWFVERGWLACGEQAIARQALDRLHREHQRSVRTRPNNAGLLVALRTATAGLESSMVTGEGWRDAALGLAALALRIAAEGDAEFPETQSGTPPRWAVWAVKQLSARSEQPREHDAFDALEEIPPGGGHEGAVN